MKAQTDKRYKTSKKYPGIRQDTKNNTFLAEASINKKRISKTFKSFQEAVQWRSSIISAPKLEQYESSSMTFKLLWETYKTNYIPTLERSSQENRLMMEGFFEGLSHLEVAKITPNDISKHICAKKEVALKIGNEKRQTFNNEIKLLKAIFNWYREEFDHTFANPVLKRHKPLGVIRTVQPKEKKMSEAEIKAFLQAMQDRPLWYDLALTQFMAAGRISEIAGLQKKNVFLKERYFLIKDVAIWSKKTKRFDHLKPKTKNGETRKVRIVDSLYDVLRERIESDLTSCPFVFHQDSEPLSYREIQYHYELALKAAGLSDRFSGTHILRHSMATLVRLITGNLDSVQAVTGHKDSKLAQHYSALDSDQNMKALTEVESSLVASGFFARAGYEQIRAECDERTFVTET